MMRLSPNDTYTASVKCLTNNESKEMIATGARLDYYMKHTELPRHDHQHLQPDQVTPRSTVKAGHQGCARRRPS